MKTQPLGVVLMSSLVGCTIVGQDYTEPKITVPSTFVGAQANPLMEAASVTWWRDLGDPLLNEIVGNGLDQNFDIRIALERIKAAEAGLRRTGLNAQVEGDVTGDARRGRIADGDINNEEFGSANAAFVFDLFGGFRRGTEASLARLDAANLDVGTVRLAYLADVVGSYISARYFQTATAITRRSIASRRETLDFVERRVAAGEATSLESAQARSLLATAEASLPGLQANYQANVFRIATLINQPAANVLNRMNRGGSQPRPRRNGSTGIPADLLRNRPDVKAAEREFAATVADIGVAEAQLYPSLELIGNVTSLGPGSTWAFGPSITIPLLSLPLRTANRDIAISRAREAELIYRQQVVQSVEETQSSLAFTNFQRRQVNSYSVATGAARDVVNLSRTSYENDTVTIIDLLDAERTLLFNELELALSRRDWATSWTRLQVSVGKGWLAGVPEVQVAAN
ncbi:MAG: efflux transporter outer membrane subunit [Roseobacter sp.]